jgi:hypothetical protein
MDADSLPRSAWFDPRPSAPFAEMVRADCRPCLRRCQANPCRLAPKFVFLHSGRWVQLRHAHGARVPARPFRNSRAGGCPGDIPRSRPPFPAAGRRPPTATLPHNGIAPRGRAVSPLLARVKPLVFRLPSWASTSFARFRLPPRDATGRSSGGFWLSSLQSVQMHQYRITKFDPAFRDTAGAYLRDEWTSFGDVGRSFGGITLSHTEYLRVESAYIEATTAFLLEDNAPNLRVIGLEIRADTPNAPPEGAWITAKAFASICRSVLRQEFWCKLEAGGRFVHFGWDYYMYVGVVSRCESSIGKAKALGLFVEEIDSPYLLSDEK